MNFRDIPTYKKANWRCNVHWAHLEQFLAGWSSDMGINTEPDFQRSHVWTDAKRTAYVEYRLKEGPSARELQWNCKTWDDFKTIEPVVLVDGLQRLTAVRRFLAGEIKAFGSYIHDYDDKLPPLRADFVFFVNNLKTREEMLEWYLQLNEGGVVHTEDELRRVRDLLEEEQRNARRLGKDGRRAAGA